MDFTIERSLEILERTPQVLDSLLKSLPEEWILQNEGGESWSPFDIVGHLIYGEKTDWIPRARIILSEAPEKRFERFDRFAQFKASEGKSMLELLAEFSMLRKQNLLALRKLNITADQLNMTGIHPAFGNVTLSQLLSNWVVHDLNHLAQISRVMAKQYSSAVGPWTEYLAILQ